jgi:dethiobiotin synthetase
MTKGFFITGTDTNVGKTFITCCLLKTLQENQKLPVYPRKPIASGAIRFTPKKLISEDAMLLKTHSLTNESLNTICPYLFEAAISPARAIKLNSANISLDNLIKACKTPNDGIRLIEGVGGFYSPLTEKYLNSNLAKHLGLEVIIVVANKLGCINQTLLTIEAVKNSNLKINCIIINDISLDADYDNFIDIKELTKEKCIHLPFQPTKTPVIINFL